MTVRKSREQRVAEGNPGRRPLPPAVVVGERIVQAAPGPLGELSPDAEAVWRELVDLLVDAGIVTSGDLYVLEHLATLIARAREVRRQLDGEPFVVEGAKHRPVLNPLLKLEENLVRQIHQLAASYGLTPSSRAGIGLTLSSARLAAARLQQDLMERVDSSARTGPTVVVAAAPLRRGGRRRPRERSTVSAAATG